jgi:hypothetical protein
MAGATANMNGGTGHQHPHPRYKRETVGQFLFFSCFLFFISYLHRCERLLAGCKSIDFF